MAEGFKRVDERFKEIDQRFEQMDERFEQIDGQLAAMREDHRTLVDVVRDLELRMDERFKDLQAGQKRLEAGQEEIRKEVAALRHDVFLEEGSRETADHRLYEDLDRRLRVVESKPLKPASGSA
ncbi:hypothetical protein [Actinomyces ruminicola]|uniref:t-SNARE coiled-coil homology domain-containing protein n=1 Tax=Actinomyces ruminicola TaxID=332524 RepID=A0A1G9Y006_9ACTO|nr:hypothetical protein [Actinomyces ruminicola]SDN02419.1 hypothetical protein SAMN04487766_1112 [Actinomyces ruminicola]